jgi:hypothetical protein
VWRRYSAGDGVRAIARGIGVERKTIAKYVVAAVAVGLARGVPPPTEDQLAAVVRGLRGTPVGRPAALPERLAPHQAQIAAWLGDGVRLTKIHRRLREQGFGLRTIDRTVVDEIETRLYRSRSASVTAFIRLKNNGIARSSLNIGQMIASLGRGAGRLEPGALDTACCMTSIKDFLSRTHRPSKPSRSPNGQRAAFRRSACPRSPLAAMVP